jgi:hypothetical protein
MSLPFTTEQFFNVIENYNVSFFPVQVILLFLGVIALLILHSARSYKSRFIGGLLGILWLWTGIAYHLVWFTEINKAAWGFGFLFIIQGILFFIESFSRKKLHFDLKKKGWHYIAYFLILFGLIIYPILLYFLKGSVFTTITLGLPCPTTIFTFGFLMLCTRDFPKYVLIIPSLWALIGTSAAINFSVYPDFMLFISMLVADVYLIFRRKEKQ